MCVLGAGVPVDTPGGTVWPAPPSGCRQRPRYNELVESQPPITLGHWLELREQVRAAELLLEDLQFAPADLSKYWAISAELLQIVQEVDQHLDEWRRTSDSADESERYLGVRKRLVAVLAKTEEIGIATDS